MFLYIINYQYYEFDLCKLEMKCLFSQVPYSKYLITDKKIDVDRSPFVKSLIDIKLTASSLNSLVYKIKALNIAYNNFKVKYIDIEKDTEFEERHKIEGIIGYYIIGNAKLHDPDITLGITKLNNEWIFGEYKKSNIIWKKHDERPYYYCNSLSTRVSRAIVNIAAGRDLNIKIVDPCCGIGTVVMEALSMGIDIKGFDINPLIIDNAKANLSFFGYDDCLVSVGDIHNLNDHYDVVILDLPYGVLSISSINEQKDLIKCASKLVPKMVIVSIEVFDDLIKSLGYKIVDSCEAAKWKFKRHITVCELSE